MLGGNTEDLQKLAIILGIGGFLGYLVADKYNKSKTLGVFLGAGATLGSMYAFHLNVRDIFNGKTKSVSAGVRMPIDQRKVECIKQGRNWDEIEKFCGMSINPLLIQNAPNNNKPCKKWVQSTCITAPCPPTCVEY